MTEAEKADLLGRFNDTKTEFPRGQTLIQLFEEQAEYIPDAAAISMNEQEMTYREPERTCQPPCPYLAQPRDIPRTSGRHYG